MESASVDFSDRRFPYTMRQASKSLASDLLKHPSQEISSEATALHSACRVAMFLKHVFSTAQGDAVTRFQEDVKPEVGSFISLVLISNLIHVSYSYAVAVSRH